MEKLYNYLLESEELYTMFEGMAGNWEKDKKKFYEAQKELEELANLTEIDLDDEE